MLRKFMILLVALSAAVMLPLSASAEIKEGSFELDPFVGGIVHDGGENLRAAPVFGLRAGYNFTKSIGVEGAVDFYRARIRDRSLSPEDLSFGKPNSDVNTLLYHVDAIYHFMPDQKFVPFVVAGVGGAHFDPNSTGVKNKLMADIGVGAKYWMTDNTAIRMDIRDVAYIGSLKQNMEATLGLVIAFGGKGKPEPAPAPAPEPAPVPAPKPEPQPEPKKEVEPAAAKVEPAPIVLEDVHFDFDKATLTDSAKAILSKNIAVIKANPGIAIRIEGNTCQHGADDYNMRLGERRASAVKEYLAKEGGIDESRMTTISYGQTRPLCEAKPTPKNKNDECMKSNRRVHFEVVVK
jgi:OOP family OmpA-OmpF porin